MASSHRCSRKPTLATGLLAVAMVALTACTGIGEPAPPTSGETSVSKKIEVVATQPHDPRLFTQGLEIRDGIVYESTGEYGQSRVMTHPLGAPAPLRTAPLASDRFGEGITLAPGGPDGGVLWQLTWKEGIAYARDPQTLIARSTVNYTGEGWGLCHQGQAPAGPRLVMSNGSNVLTFRDPITFDEIGSVAVTRDGQPVDRLNELECVGDTVYANVFTTDEIVEIDPATGTVRATIDASEAADSLPAGVTDDPNAVLNGIAALPGTDRFWITGKLWPSIFEVRFVEE